MKENEKIERIVAVKGYGLSRFVFYYTQSVPTVQLAKVDKKICAPFVTVHIFFRVFCVFYLIYRCASSFVMSSHVTPVSTIMTMR